MDARERTALAQVGSFLRSEHYRFVTVTPATHARWLEKKAGAVARSLRDIFGWNLPFHAQALPPAILSSLEAAGALAQEGSLLKSAVRFATLDDFLFAHSGYPTLDAESVFFGPDTYRFVDLLRRTVGNRAWKPDARMIDVGTGSGAGGLVGARLAGVTQPILADVSAVALAFARSNAQLCGARDCRFEAGDLFCGIDGVFDLIVCNPPYMKDPLARRYRDGGGNYGAELSARIVRESVARLAPGGMLVLYTGVAFVDGDDVFKPVVASELGPLGWRYAYREIDPDVFGEEIAQPGYAAVERLAAVGLVVERPN